MTTRSGPRIANKPLQPRRQPSILQRKRKNESGGTESSSNVSFSDNSNSNSPVSKYHCGSSQDAKIPVLESASPQSALASSSSLLPLPSSSVEAASSELSVESVPTSCFGEDVPLSPAAPRLFRSLTCLPTPDFSTSRHSPLPQLDWADPKEVWELMLHKDVIYPRTCNLLAHHPQLQPRMRAILLDWLMEVSEVYKLHRETYYLAQDFIDRYLASQKNLPKQQLQLLGITCLFIAAKIEEIYPPNLYEFSYVTDNACTENEIIEKELVVLKVLNWDLTPLTVNGWLNVYLQLASNTTETFDFPSYPGIIFVKVAQLVDLCMLDVKALRFPYGILAISALYHTTNNRQVALSCSGLEWSEMRECVEWMRIFAQTVREEAKDVDVESFKNVLPEDQHNIQTHTIDLTLLDSAMSRQTKILNSTASPLRIKSHLTPPRSARKVKLSP